MSVKTKYYYGSPGNYDIIDAELTNVTLLWVTRTGAVYHEAVGPPEGLRYGYQNAFGRILFGNPFFGPTYPERPSLRSLEKISVKFKY